MSKQNLKEVFRDLKEALEKIEPANEWMAAVLNYYYGAEYKVEAPKITKIFVDREGLFRIWIEGSGDNIPLGQVKDVTNRLIEIGQQIGLSPKGIQWYLDLAKDQTMIAGSRFSRGPKLLPGPTGEIEMPWETDSMVLDARQHSKEDFLIPQFPLVEQFHVPEIPPGVLETSKSWVNGRDFEALVLFRMEFNSTRDLLPYALAPQASQSIEDGALVPVHFQQDLWQNLYLWVERKKIRIPPLRSQYSFGDLRRIQYQLPGNQVLEFGARYIDWPLEHKPELPGWTVFFRLANGQENWFRAPAELLLRSPDELLDYSPPERTGVEHYLAFWTAKFHKFKFPLGPDDLEPRNLS